VQTVETHKTINADDPTQLQGIGAPETNLSAPSAETNFASDLDFFVPGRAGQTAKTLEQEPPVPSLQRIVIPEPTKPSATNTDKPVSNEIPPVVITQAVATQEATQEPTQEALPENTARMLNFDLEIPLKNISVDMITPHHSNPSLLKSAEEWRLNNMPGHLDNWIRIRQPKEKILPITQLNLILESRQNKEGVDQWMVTWTSSQKVCLLFPNIGWSLVGKF
jgi:hypothetical protein